MGDTDLLMEQRAVLYGLLLLGVLAAGQGEDGSSPVVLQDESDNGNMLGESQGARADGVELVGAKVSVGATGGEGGVSVEAALETGKKAEEKAKEDNEKAVEQREKDQKGAKEAALKKDVKKMGFEKMQKKKEAREELADKQMLKEGREKVLIRKKKANMDCKSECIAAGKKKEETTTPVFLGCYKD